LCGIIGFVGQGNAVPVLLDGLKRLEYRGYDSVGLAVLEGGELRVRKSVGTVEKLVSLVEQKPLQGRIGLAHTRWATHGGVVDENAHPHVSCDGSLAVVHNGIIENFGRLRRELESRGHRFRSQTDTEVVAHLLEECLQEGMGLEEAGVKLASKLEGQYAIVALSRKHPDSLLALRRRAPLLIGVGNGENVIASDALAFIDRTNRAIFMEDDTIAVVSRGPEIRLLTFIGRRLKPEAVEVARELSTPDKKDYEHFTLKEIHEQPEVIIRVLDQDAGALTLFRREVEGAERVFFVASGSSYHASLVGKQLFAQGMGVYSDVILASEYKAVEEWFKEGVVVVAISQSGETADVLAGVEAAKSKGATVLSIVNRTPSSLERYSDVSLKLNVGAEVGVAATKSMTAQMAMLYVISRKDSNGGEMRALADAIGTVLKSDPLIYRVSEQVKERRDVYFLGRGLSYPVALEGALKLKELAYIHAEGLAAGELKHGPLALIERGTPLVLVNPPDETYEETLANGSEVKARGGSIIGVSTRSDRIYDWFIKIPELRRELYPVVSVVPLQLLAYHTARLLNADVDKPRNLAKSVTVK
jgi:glucosamine--fructose-6-phosphate aminotransferase (isomerizing)